MLLVGGVWGVGWHNQHNTIKSRLGSYISYPKSKLARHLFCTTYDDPIELAHTWSIVFSL